jgi:hypothetical protein
MDEHGLERAVWTDADFDHMGWHDATVRGMACPQELNGSDLSFDIDYIVRWLNPEAPEASYRFWVAPATLTFLNVWSMDSEFVQTRRFEIDAIRREDPLNDRQVTTGTRPWVIDGHTFDIRLLASGFEQIFRQPPVLTEGQSLSDEARGGVSFDRIPFA